MTDVATVVTQSNVITTVVEQSAPVIATIDERVATVVLQPALVVSVVQPPPVVVTVPIGASGPPGTKFLHTQSTPLSTWVINHNLGARPNISVTSMGGVEYLVEIIHATVNQAVVYFEAPAAGFATCS